MLFDSSGEGRLVGSREESLRGGEESLWEGSNPTSVQQENSGVTDVPSEHRGSQLLKMPASTFLPQRAHEDLSCLLCLFF